MKKKGKYVYCIIGAWEEKSFGNIGIGERGDKVYTICFDDISAVVSDSDIDMDYSASRKNLLAHEKAIEEAMKGYTVLPVRFATIVEDEEKVRRILEKKHAEFKNLLNDIEGKKELSLKAIFKESVIYEDILERYEDLRKFKEVIVAKPPEQTYYQRIEIGKMLEHILEGEKDKYKEEILSILSPLAEDIKINGSYGERMIFNAAFLVNEGKESAFDQNINKLDEKYGNKITFKYVGNLPPFNFVNLIIETTGY